MLDWMVMERVADAIGVTNGESIAAISQALSYLGISDDTSNIAIRLSGDHDQDGARVEFDFGARQWRLTDPRTRSQDGIDNEGATSNQPQGGRESPDVSPDTYDWIETLPLTEHVHFLVNLAWEKTLLGPIRKWPITLRLMTQKMLVDPRPACLYWYVANILVSTSSNFCI